MTEVELRIDGKSAFEYYTHSIPRVGDNLDINHEHTRGYFKVTKVIHRVFQRKTDNSVLSYVTVEAETIKKKQTDVKE